MDRQTGRWIYEVIDRWMNHKTDRQTIKVMTDGQTETDRPTARQINRSNTCNLNISLSLHTPSKQKSFSPLDCYSTVNNIP